jgi:hypothetical protein
MTPKTNASREKSGAFLTCLVLLAALFLYAQHVVGQRTDEATEVPETAFVCPMHPDYTTDAPGSCPRCGMALVKASPFDVRDYEIDLQTVPPLVKPGQRAELRLRVTHPGTGELVKQFELVHERRFHLFLISQDMTYFEHLHPVLQGDGTWTIEVTLPRAGYYKVLADFLPAGGSWQFIARPLVTADVEGDLAAGSATLVPDTTPTSTVDDMTAAITYDPPTFVAGLYGHLSYHLTDAATGQPVTDLQTYLGAFGHTLVMSEDMAHYVHAHPLDIVPGSDEDGTPEFVIPPGTDLETLRGGPDVTFDGLMPKAGRYRAWTQFRRLDKVYTFTSTFEVAAP